MRTLNATLACCIAAALLLPLGAPSALASDPPAPYGGCGYFFPDQSGNLITLAFNGWTVTVISWDNTNRLYAIGCTPPTGDPADCGTVLVDGYGTVGLTKGSFHTTGQCTGSWPAGPLVSVDVTCPAATTCAPHGNSQTGNVGSTTLVCKLDASKLTVPVGFWTHCWAGTPGHVVCDTVPAAIIACPITVSTDSLPQIDARIHVSKP